MQWAHNITRWLFKIYVILLAAAAIGAFGVLKLAHLKVLSVQTSSMAPTFQPGDVVLVSPLWPSTVQVGQVVTFVSPASGQLISHRVVAVDRQRSQLTTRGDAVKRPDTPIASSAVIGRVVRVLPKAGTVLHFLRRPIGLAIFLYLPALAIVGNEINRLSRHYSRGYYRLRVLVNSR